VGEVTDRKNTVQTETFKQEEKVEKFKKEMNWCARCVRSRSAPAHSCSASGGRQQEELGQWTLAQLQKQEDHEVLLQYVLLRPEPLDSWPSLCRRCRYSKEDEAKRKELDLQVRTAGLQWSPRRVLTDCWFLLLALTARQGVADSARGRDQAAGCRHREPSPAGARNRGVVASAPR
jgi:hypothetical protein